MEVNVKAEYSETDEMTDEEMREILETLGLDLDAAFNMQEQSNNGEPIAPVAPPPPPQSPNPPKPPIKLTPEEVDAILIAHGILPKPNE